MSFNSFEEKEHVDQKNAHEPEETAEISPSPETLSFKEESNLNGQILELEQKLATVQEDLLRSLADLDNMRKRTVREQEEVRKYALTQFARDILSVSDNLERAVSALPTETNDPHTRPIVEGVQFVQQDLINLLKRHQVQKMTSLHVKFDPHLHQAMLEVETTEHNPGTVVQVLQEGYMLADRLLRPALVGVAKAPVSLCQKEN